MEQKKILVIGGTGAMGMYLVPMLVEKGYRVDVASLDDVTASGDNPRYLKRDLKDVETLKKTLAEGYDAVVDFLIYTIPAFRERVEIFLANTGHYVFLSSYRVYADEEHPVKETSPRLLDVSDDKTFLSRTDYEYSLYKAVQEDILRASPHRNWTVVRPSITFSKRRFQLATLEAPDVVGRAIAGKTVLLPEGARNVQGTLTWAGDTAKLFCAVLENPGSYGETYSFTTAEHHTWEEIAELYHEYIGLNYIFVPDEDYLDVIAGDKDPATRLHFSWQLALDREFDRVMDNSKILSLAGLRQEDLTPLRTALRRELDALPRDLAWPSNARMDAYLAKHGL